MNAPAFQTDRNLSDTGSLSADASHLGYEIVDIAGFLDTVDGHARAQEAEVASVRDIVTRLVDANASVRTAIDTIADRAESAIGAMEDTVRTIQASTESTEKVAQWVQHLDARMTRIETQLDGVQKQNAEITAIAKQVNILAINAKIEAARAGDKGQGFVVVADAVNELSRKTAAAAETISGSIGALSGEVVGLKSESADIGSSATGVLDGVGATNAALDGLAVQMRTTFEDSRLIRENSRAVRSALDQLEPAFERMSEGVAETTGAIDSARSRSHDLIDRSERIVQASFGIGAPSADRVFIERVQSDAQALGAAIEAAIERGEIGLEAVFSTRYEPIGGTDPEQFLLPITKITDRYFPSIQEPALAFDPKVVFCAAVDVNGYLPTHNKKFSHPQRSGDPEWNAANARNRRMFDDRVGLKAGRSTEPFLMQVYRRDMGGGTFVMMKDLSAPIHVRGRHWGGLRLAYRFD